MDTISTAELTEGIAATNAEFGVARNLQLPAGTVAMEVEATDYPANVRTVGIVDDQSDQNNQGWYRFGKGFVEFSLDGENKQVGFIFSEELPSGALLRGNVSKLELDRNAVTSMEQNGSTRSEFGDACKRFGFDKYRHTDGSEAVLRIPDSTLSLRPKTVLGATGVSGQYIVVGEDGSLQCQSLHPESPEIKGKDVPRLQTGPVVPVLVESMSLTGETGMAGMYVKVGDRKFLQEIPLRRLLSKAVTAQEMGGNGTAKWWEESHPLVNDSASKRLPRLFVMPSEARGISSPISHMLIDIMGQSEVECGFVQGDGDREMWQNIQAWVGNDEKHYQLYRGYLGLELAESVVRTMSDKERGRLKGWNSYGELDRTIGEMLEMRGLTEQERESILAQPIDAELDFQVGVEGATAANELANWQSGLKGLKLRYMLGKPINAEQVYQRRRELADLLEGGVDNAISFLVSKPGKYKWIKADELGRLQEISIRMVNESKSLNHANLIDAAKRMVARLRDSFESGETSLTDLDGLIDVLVSGQPQLREQMEIRAAVLYRDSFLARCLTGNGRVGDLDLGQEIVQMVEDDRTQIQPEIMIGALGKVVAHEEVALYVAKEWLKRLPVEFEYINPLERLKSVKDLELMANGLVQFDAGKGWRPITLDELTTMSQSEVERRVQQFVAALDHAMRKSILEDMALERGIYPDEWDEIREGIRWRNLLVGSDVHGEFYPIARMEIPDNARVTEVLARLELDMAIMRSTLTSEQGGITREALKLELKQHFKRALQDVVKLDRFGGNAYEWLETQVKLVVDAHDNLFDVLRFYETTKLQDLKGSSLAWLVEQIERHRQLEELDLILDVIGDVASENDASSESLRDSIQFNKELIKNSSYWVAGLISRGVENYRLGMKRVDSELFNGVTNGVELMHQIPSQPQAAAFLNDYSGAHEMYERIQNVAPKGVDLVGMVAGWDAIKAKMEYRIGIVEGIVRSFDKPIFIYWPSGNVGKESGLVVLNLDGDIVSTSFNTIQPDNLDNPFVVMTLSELMRCFGVGLEYLAQNEGRFRVHLRDLVDVNKVELPTDAAFFMVVPPDRHDDMKTILENARYGQSRNLVNPRQILDGALGNLAIQNLWDTKPVPKYEDLVFEGKKSGGGFVVRLKKGMRD